MNRFDRILLRWIFRRIIRQGPGLEDDLAQAFAEIRKVWSDEFTEDNRFTQIGHLREIFEASEKLRGAQ